MKRRSETGQTLITVVFSMVVLIGFMGLAVDMGYLRHVKRQMQSAADSAAIAGAAEIPFPDVTSAAKADSARNGFKDESRKGVEVTEVTVNHPPVSGQHNGDSNYVEVIVAQTQPTFFMSIFRVASVPLSARAVGTLASSRGPLYALGGGDAINTNGDVDVDVPNGTITDNGNLAADGGGSIIASSIGVVGSVPSGGITISPDPKRPIAPITDPLSTLPGQPVDACKVPSPFVISKSMTVDPGTYCGLIIKGSGGGGGGDEGGDDDKGPVSVHFNPGVYVLTDGITVNGSATLSGTDVTFFNSGGSIAINGDVNNDVVTLSAPTTGTYAGILFFQDSNNTSSATITGADGSKIEGALYFPQAQLTTNGGGSAAYTIVVAKTIVFKGGATFKNDFSSLPGGSPVKTAVLAE